VKQRYGKLILGFVTLLLANCATVPQQQIVARAEALPTQKIAVTLPCVSLNEMPSIPVTAFDPKATYTEQLLEQERIDIDNFKIYAATADALLLGCLSEPKP
jgi:hypothetical protein